MVITKYDEKEMTFEERTHLREKYKEIGFSGYQVVYVYKLGENIKAVVFENDGSIYKIQTQRGMFFRTYANRYIEIIPKAFTDNYIEIVVQNNLQKVQRLDISRTIKI